MNYYITLSIIMVMLFSCTNQTKLDKAEFSGEDISAFAQILRDKQTKAATLHIQTVGKWALYSGTSVEGIDFSSPLLEGNGSGEYLLQVPDSVRSYFQLITESGRGILTERHLPMTGGYNFRDLGGYRTTDGRYVKWGMIIRSDDLYHLTDSDLNYLSSLPLITVIDFRAEAEIEAAPDKLPQSVLNYYPYCVNPGNLSGAGSLQELDFSDGENIMQRINRELVEVPEIIARYKAYFAVLQDSTQIPVLFHCSAGKDRTGMAAALTLFALGVDEETIMNDYLMSNVYLADKYAPYIAFNETLKPLFEVKKEYIGAGLQRIKELYGSVDTYLTDYLDVDIEALRAKFLYEASR